VTSEQPSVTLSAEATLTKGVGGSTSEGGSTITVPVINTQGGETKGVGHLSHSVKAYSITVVSGRLKLVSLQPDLQQPKHITKDAEQVSCSTSCCDSITL
jgi:hypothetical protein